MTELPEWLQKELPELRKETVLSYEGNQYVVTYPDDTKENFSELEEAYDSVDSKEYNLYLDESLPGYDGSGMFFGEVDENKGTGRLMMSFTDKDHYDSLVEEYEEFLQVAKEYDNNSNDFVNSYKFVNQHPAFWVRGTNEKTFDWATASHAEYGKAKLTLSMIKKDDKPHFWCIETGQHQDPEYIYRYLDPRLESHGDTVEEAFITLASLIKKFFNNDGTEIPNVEYEKQEWVKDLENSIDKIKDWHSITVFWYIYMY